MGVGEVEAFTRSKVSVPPDYDAVFEADLERGAVLRLLVVAERPSFAVGFGSLDASQLGLGPVRRRYFSRPPRTVTDSGWPRDQIRPSRSTAPDGLRQREERAALLLVAAESVDDEDEPADATVR